MILEPLPEGQLMTRKLAVERIVKHVLVDGGNQSTGLIRQWTMGFAAKNSSRCLYRKVDSDGTVVNACFIGLLITDAQYQYVWDINDGFDLDAIWPDIKSGFAVEFSGSSLNQWTPYSQLQELHDNYVPDLHGPWKEYVADSLIEWAAEWNILDLSPDTLWQLFAFLTEEGTDNNPLWHQHQWEKISGPIRKELDDDATAHRMVA